MKVATVCVKDYNVKKLKNIIHTAVGTKPTVQYIVQFLNDLWVDKGPEVWFKDLCAARNEGSLTEEQANKLLEIRYPKEATNGKAC